MRDDHDDGDGDDDEAEDFADAIELRCSGVVSSASRFSIPAMRPISVCMPVAVTTALPCPYVAAVPLKTMLCRRPAAPRRQSARRLFVTGQALARQCRFRRLQRRRFDQPRIGGNGVAFFNENDVAGHDLGRLDACRSPSRMTIASCRRHLPKRRHGRFRARLLDVPHVALSRTTAKMAIASYGQRRFALIHPETGRNGVAISRRMTSTS